MRRLFACSWLLTLVSALQVAAIQERIQVSGQESSSLLNLTSYLTDQTIKGQTVQIPHIPHLLSSGLRVDDMIGELSAVYSTHRNPGVHKLASKRCAPSIHFTSL